MNNHVSLKLFLLRFMKKLTSLFYEKYNSNIYYKNY